MCNTHTDRHTSTYTNRNNKLSESMIRSEKESNSIKWHGYRYTRNWYTIIKRLIVREIEFRFTANNYSRIVDDFPSVSFFPLLSYTTREYMNVEHRALWLVGQLNRSVPFLFRNDNLCNILRIFFAFIYGTFFRTFFVMNSLTYNYDDTKTNIVHAKKIH